jgi:hypothetical protein
MGYGEDGGVAKMMGDKGFVYSGLALLLAIPVVVLMASAVNMMEIGDITTSMVIRSDTVYNPCDDIKNSFEFSAQNYADVYGEQSYQLVKDRLDNRWLPTINWYYRDASITISISSIDVSFDSSTSSTKIWSGTQTQGVNITITDEGGKTKCEAVAGPYTIPVGEDTEGPIFTFIVPANRTYCEPILNLVLQYTSSEPAFDVEYSLDGGTRGNATSGITNFTFTSSGPHNLTLYGVDAANNSGNTTVDFYIKKWSYVSDYNITDGNVNSTSGNLTDPIFDAKNPADGNEAANITELSNSSTLTFPRFNHDFTSGSMSPWNSYTTGNLANFYDTPSDLIYSEIDGNNENGTGLWNVTFPYNFNGSASANVSFRYRVDDYDAAKAGFINRFKIELVTPTLGTWTCKKGGVIAGGWVDIENTTSWEIVNCNNLHKSWFVPGTFTINIFSELDMDGPGRGQVKVSFDYVRLDVETPIGYRYDVEFITDDTADFVDWQDHELQIKYRMPSPNPEVGILSIWNKNTSMWSVIENNLQNTSTWSVFSYNMTIDEYNSGNVRVKYDDIDPTDVSSSTIQIDYHRVC